MVRVRSRAVLKSTHEVRGFDRPYLDRRTRRCAQRRPVKGPCRPAGMAWSTSSKPGGATKLHQVVNGEDERGFRPKPEKRTFELYSNTTFITLFTHFFQLIRSSFDRPNKNNMQLSCAIFGPFQQRVCCEPPAGMLSSLCKRSEYRTLFTPSTLTSRFQIEK